MQAHHPSYWLRHGDTADGATGYRALSASPTLATDGIPVPPNRRDSLATLLLRHTAAGARSFTAVIWGYQVAANVIVAGALAAVSHASASGWVNLGTIDVSGAADGAEAHQLEGISGFSRLAVETTTEVGAPSIWADFGFSLHTEEV